MPFTGVSAMDLKQEFVRLALAEGANRREGSTTPNVPTRLST